MSEHVLPMPEDYDDAALLEALRPTAEMLLERHIDSAEEWFPHMVVPWSQGRDFKKDEAWDASESSLDDRLRDIIYVDMIDKDNVSHHFRSITTLSPADHPLRDWAKLLAAEEDRHAIALREWLTVTRAVDPHQLEHDRMEAVSHYEEQAPTNIVEGLTFWRRRTDLARYRHTELSRQLPDTAGRLIMRRIAGDEERQGAYWSDLTTAAWSIDAASMAVAVARRLAKERRQRRTPRVNSL